MANRTTATQMLAEACGQPFDEVLEDSSRTFYLSPDEGVEYGFIDKALRSSKKDEVRTPSFLDAMSMGASSARPSSDEDYFSTALLLPPRVSIPVLSRIDACLAAD
eukprot:jgi/Undpi1/1821/HiC_scaffold_12.g05208.m1